MQDPAFRTDDGRTPTSSPLIPRLLSATLLIIVLIASALVRGCDCGNVSRTRSPSMSASKAKAGTVSLSPSWSVDSFSESSSRTGTIGTRTRGPTASKSSTLTMSIRLLSISATNRHRSGILTATHSHSRTKATPIATITTAGIRSPPQHPSATRSRHSASSRLATPTPTVTLNHEGSATVHAHSWTHPEPTTTPTPPFPPRTTRAAVLPVPAEVVAARQTAAVVQVSTEASTSVASAAAMNPAVATQAGKLASLRTLINCADEEDGGATEDGVAAEHAQPGVTAHPLRFSLPVLGDAVAYTAASVIGNVAIVVFLALATAFVAAPLRLAYRRRHDPEYTYAAALAWCRFPAVLSVPLAALLPPTATASAECLSSLSVTTTTAARILGAAGLLGCALVVAASVIVYRRCFRHRFVWRTEREASAANADDTAGAPPMAGSAVVDSDTDSALVDLLANDDDAKAPHPPVTWIERRVDAMVVVEDKEWAAWDPARTHELMRHYGMFFDVYRGKAPWFFVLELGVTGAASVLAGLRHRVGCAVTPWLLATLYVGAAVLYVFVRPHAVRLDRLLYAALAVAQAAAAVFGAASGVLSASHGADAATTLRTQQAASFFLSSVGASAGLVGVYEIAKVVYAQIRLRRHKRAAADAAAARNTHGDADKKGSALPSGAVLQVPPTTEAGQGPFGPSEPAVDDAAITPPRSTVVPTKFCSPTAAAGATEVTLEPSTDPAAPLDAWLLSLIDRPSTTADGRAANASMDADEESNGSAATPIPAAELTVEAGAALRERLHAKLRRPVRGAATESPPCPGPSTMRRKRDARMNAEAANDADWFGA